MKQIWIALPSVLGAAVVGCLGLWGCVGPGKQTQLHGRDPASQQARVHEVPEGLKGADLADFEHLSEGADIYPYEWMVALNSIVHTDKDGKPTKPFLQDLDKHFGVLRSSAVQTTSPRGERRTYLIPYVGMTAGWSDHDPDKADAYLEEQFPVVREINRESKRLKSVKLVGTNCAFCHSGALNFKGTSYQLPGSPSMVNVRSFFLDLSRSTLAILAKEELMSQFLQRLNVADAPARAKELNRFFKKRLAETTHGVVNAGSLSARLTLAKAKIFKDTTRLYQSKDAIGETLEKLLRITYGFSDTDDIGELKYRMKFLSTMMVGTDPKTKETISGYARTDAFGRIGNLVLRGDSPVSYTAPVSLPWIWGIKYMAMLHYNANTNSVILRNVGQSLGLGAIILDQDLNSTVNLHNLDRIENLVHKIPVPNWQKTFAGVTELEINQGLAQQGRAVYTRACASCHESNTFVGPSGLLRDYAVTPLKHLGTDPFAAKNAILAVGKLEFNKSIFNGVGGIKLSYYRRYRLTEEEISKMEFRDLRGNEFFRDTLNGFSGQEQMGNTYGNIAPGAGYKARHLAGVWATAPYLHNGSVPSLAALLEPVHMRPKVFTVEPSDFDPRTLGNRYRLPTKRNGKPGCTEAVREICFDTSLDGNSNAGHEYGTNLTAAEKAALLEYLKVLPPEPEYAWEN